MTELKDIIQDIDRDNDGSIDYNEFLRLMSTKLKDAQTEDELLEAFNVFDSAGKGCFGEPELTDVAMRLKCNFTPEDIKEMIAVADLNGDQAINFEEFVGMMKSAGHYSRVDGSWQGNEEKQTDDLNVCHGHLR